MAITALQKVQSFASLVKLSHTVFAMPFALGMFVLLSRSYSTNLLQLVWIVLALVSARTAAMAYNRLVDRDIDAKNPRTVARELPAKVLTVRSVWSLLAFSVCIFFLSAALLGTHCLILAPLVIAALLFYSHTKRFTHSTHLFLGFALALAPGGVWYAVTTDFALQPISLMVAVLMWVAGFDILYSCQDAEFDESQGLHSIPRRFGSTRAFHIARLLHLFAVALLILFGLSMNLGISYFIGVVAFTLVMFSQHLFVSPDDLSKIDAAFFTRNGIASIVFFFACCADIWIR